MPDDYESYAGNLNSMIEEQREHLGSGCPSLPFCIGPAAMQAFKAALSYDPRYAWKMVLVAVTELRQARDEMAAQEGMLRDASMTMEGLADESNEKDAQIASLTAVIAELQQQLGAREIGSPVYGESS